MGGIGRRSLWFPVLCGLPEAPSCVWGLFFVVGVVGDGVDVVVGLVG